MHTIFFCTSLLKITISLFAYCFSISHNLFFTRLNNCESLVLKNQKNPFKEWQCRCRWCQWCLRLNLQLLPTELHQPRRWLQSAPTNQVGSQPTVEDHTPEFGRLTTEIRHKTSLTPRITQLPRPLQDLSRKELKRLFKILLYIA